MKFIEQIEQDDLECYGTVVGPKIEKGCAATENVVVTPWWSSDPYLGTSPEVEQCKTGRERYGEETKEKSVNNQSFVNKECSR